MFAKTKHFLSLIRFSHTIFALPFALLAALMAWRLTGLEQFGEFPEELGEDYRALAGRVVAIGSVQIYMPLISHSRFGGNWQQLLGILLCMVAARSAAMAFNRLADRNIDAENPRTAGRHIPAGILSAGQVTAFALACSAAFVAGTLLFLPNRLPLYLSIPVLLFLLGYSYAKRFTALAHFWLGAALAMSPVCVWIAIRGEAVIERPADLLPAVGARRRRVGLGRRIRHHLRLPGPRIRPAGEAPQRAGLARREGRSAAGGHVPFGDNYLPGRPAVGLSALRLGLWAGRGRGGRAAGLRARDRPTRRS